MLRDSFWPINALLLKAPTQEILRWPNPPDVRRGFVLDEFRVMQRVECVHDLLNLGRFKVNGGRGVRQNSSFKLRAAGERYVPRGD